MIHINLELVVYWQLASANNDIVCASLTYLLLVGINIITIDGGSSRDTNVTGLETFG